MNFFPDQLVTTHVGFHDPSNVFECIADRDAGILRIRCILGTAIGYQAILYYNGRLLIGFQELWEGHNEKFDFHWQGFAARAVAANGEIHELKCDAK